MYSIDKSTIFLSTFSLFHISLQLPFRLSVVPNTHPVSQKLVVLEIDSYQKQYIGCYLDEGSVRAMNANGKHTSNRMTPQYCIDLCTKAVSKKANDYTTKMLDGNNIIHL
jgi:hypothetical protein